LGNENADFRAGSRAGAAGARAEDREGELRRRLLWSVVVLAILFFACFYFATQIFAFLVQPLLAAGQGRIIFTDIFEAFFVEVKVALFAALMLGFPFFATQMWKFVAPGLYVKEKKALLPFLLLTPVFFIGGAAFAYYVAMPWALHFLLSYQGDVGGVTQEALPGVGNYLSFSTRFLFGFGVAFLLPILLHLKFAEPRLQLTLLEDQVPCLLFELSPRVVKLSRLISLCQGVASL
jgi:sec-independent protein translocase protein TatC